MYYMQYIIISLVLRSLIGWKWNIVIILYPSLFLKQNVVSIRFGDFRIVHSKLAYICVCIPMYNYLLQPPIDMHSGHCETIY